MPFVHIVIGLALVQFLFFGLAVASARGRYKVAAPATTGDAVFERYFRVHMNTLEILVVFIPGILMFGQYWSPSIAAGLGVVFLLGRLVYFFSYVKDPKSREFGFILSVGPTVILLAGGLIGAARAALYY